MGQQTTEAHDGAPDVYEAKLQPKREYGGVTPYSSANRPVVMLSVAMLVDTPSECCAGYHIHDLAHCIPPRTQVKIGVLGASAEDRGGRVPGPGRSRAVGPLGPGSGQACRLALPGPGWEILPSPVFRFAEAMSGRPRRARRAGSIRLWPSSVGLHPGSTGPVVWSVVMPGGSDSVRRRCCARRGIGIRGGAASGTMGAAAGRRALSGVRGVVAGRYDYYQERGPAHNGDVRCANTGS